MRFRKLGKHTLIISVIASLLITMMGLVAYSPTLYRIFCAVTGFGGTVNRAVAIQNETVENKDTPTLTVSFNSDVAPGLDWDFKPAKRKVTVHIGQPQKVYYYARNNTDETIVARAVYNVTPYKVAPYFFKIECFCFTEERLGPGEEAKMPLVFYVDKQFMKDENVQDVTNITLSYTFYKQKDLDVQEIQAARGLKKGSEKLDADLSAEDASAAFENDARRR